MLAASSFVLRKRAYVTIAAVITTAGQRRFQLEFKNVTETAKSNYPPIPYSVKDLGGNRRKIIWRKPVKSIDVKKALGKNRKTVPKKRTRTR